MELFMCTLCGVAVSDSFGEAWLKEFRVIYARPPSWDDVKLSGVCLAETSDENHDRDTGIIVARCLRDPRKRYDDEDLGPNSKVMVKLGPDAPSPDQLMPRSVARCGFAFHAACWDLLAKMGHMDISVLFSVCFSMPIVDTAMIQWGHDYGGAARPQPYTNRWAGFQPEDLFPHPKSSLFRSDPMNIPDLHYLAQCAVRFEPPAYPWPSTQATNDVFYRLPVEILQAILTTLSSPDVARLRTASRAVACLDLPEPFWASRFQDGYEYAHIFESSPQRPRSWKALYMFTRILERQSPALQNRARVWKLGSQIKHLHDQVEGIPCQGLPLASKFEPDYITDDREWFVASDGLLENTSDRWYHFQDGCGGLRIREMKLPTPSELFRLTVSFTVLNNRKFISGLQFINREGESRMSGWHLALGKSGIQAIALELDDRTGSLGLVTAGGSLLQPGRLGPDAISRPLLEKVLFQPATLVRVTAYVFDLDAVAGIEFSHADSTHDSLLGQRMPFSTRPYWVNSYSPHGEDHASSMEVDGPNGERITEIRIEESRDGPLEMEVRVQCIYCLVVDF
ncbi:unnamed protein product [Clonostachys solani]|uniref:F-box domain-containing protein n=1 Tax=Clonostachys solani TaxID=160281 RepID=A0A9P0ESF8_9HYPO|nr:unnamed protein product [Clonostachys solani]